MSEYKLMAPGFYIKRLSDGALVSPTEPGYVQFLAAGGVPDPADPPSAEMLRAEAQEAAIRSDSDALAWKNLTPAEFDARWTAEMETGTQAQQFNALQRMVKRLVRIILRRVL